MIGAAATKGDQESHMYVRHVARHIANLPSAHREALVLVGANGYSYENATTRTPRKSRVVPWEP